MKREELELFLQHHGYKQDSHRHYKKEVRGELYRYKMQKTSVRQEVRVGEGAKSFWFKRWSEYYCNLEINPRTQKLRRIDEPSFG